MQSVFLESSRRTFVLTVFVLALTPYATSKCTPNGYYCPNINQFQVCPEGGSQTNPLPDLYPCPTGTTCNDNCNSPDPCTLQPCPVTCTSSNNQAIPDITDSYYRCEVGANGEVTVTVKTCPTGTSFNMVQAKCVDITPEPTQPPPFRCSQSGRFPHPTDCNKYYQCASNWGGTFTQYQYNCPLGATFNVYTKLCCYDARYCILNVNKEVL